MTSLLHRYFSRESSGVGWLSDVPAHWDVRHLKHVASYRTSNVDKKTKDEEPPVRLCNYTDVYYGDRIRVNEGEFMEATASLGEIDRFRLRVGDVVITKDSEDWQDIAVPALIDETAADFVCGYHLGVIRAGPAMDAVFLYRAIQSVAVNRQLQIAAAGVTRYGLPNAAVGNVLLPLPPLPEQRAIARYLDYVDRRIRRYVTAKRRLIELLEEERQAVVNQAVTMGLDRNVRLKPSGIDWLGDVPEPWEVRRGKRLFSPRRELARPDDIQLSATQAYGVIPQDEYEQRIGRKVVKISFHLNRRRHVEVDDFVISMRSFEGGLERAWAAGAIRSSYIVLRPAMDVNVDFFSHLFKSQAYIRALQSTANFIRDGQDLTFNNFCAVALPFPPAEEQELIAVALQKATANIDTTMARTRRQIQLVEEYRTRLIADVVTGKLDVREAALRLLNDEGDHWLEDAPSADSLDGGDHVSEEPADDPAIESEVTV